MIAVTPYIGIGVGAAFHSTGRGTVIHAVGVAPPTPAPRLEDITANQLRIGVRYDLRSEAGGRARSQRARLLPRHDRA